MKKKTAVLYTQDTIDCQTGEVQTRKVLKKTVQDKHEFVMLYFEHISLINRLTPMQTKFLLSIVKYVEWNTNDILFHARAMEELVNESGIARKTIRNMISQFCSIGIFNKQKSNWYKLNPRIFFKGSEVERAKMIELSYRWEIKN